MERGEKRNQSFLQAKPWAGLLVPSTAKLLLAVSAVLAAETSVDIHFIQLLIENLI